jgi:N4-(beta-N-acetylglucosaminyl)-L-asparaginase
MSDNESSTASSRRTFLKQASMAGAGAALLPQAAQGSTPSFDAATNGGPLVVASDNGEPAAERALEVMANDGEALDAVIEGVNIVERDPDDITVGYGGIPNAEGTVQLEAGVVEGKTHRAGAVAVLEDIPVPSRVARVVMERTDHVRLVGQGAKEFAKMHGFETKDLLTERARKIWVKWKESLSDEDDYLPPDSLKDEALGAKMREVQRHYGTIHCSALAPNGNIGSVTTTSGLFYKIPGRVADTSVVGAGLYADNDVGAAGSTGRGEANLKNLSSYLIVERMREGDAPEDACLFACRRIAENTQVPRLLNDQDAPNFGVRFYALRKDGKFGGAQMRGAGQMIVGDADGVRLVDIPGLFDENE